MTDTFMKTIQAEPALVSRALVRMDGYRALEAKLDADADAQITVTPALEGATVAIRLMPHSESDAVVRRWPAISAEARRHARALLRELASCLEQEPALPVAA